MLLTVLVRVLQRNRTNRMLAYIYKEIYYKELAHVIMDTENSQDLPPISWRWHTHTPHTYTQTQTHRYTHRYTERHNLPPRDSCGEFGAYLL